MKSPRTVLGTFPLSMNLMKSIVSTTKKKAIKRNNYKLKKKQNSMWSVFLGSLIDHTTFEVLVKAYSKAYSAKSLF